MPKIINNLTNDFVEIQEGNEIREACEELGVPFNCSKGTCGTCMIDVISGENNLSELTEKEMDLERDKKHRLACQCRIKNSDVKIEF
ncbi:MAG: 2Fe-2S iron-sulfur cluster binding domain-containing protein [archaeon]